MRGRPSVVRFSVSSLMVVTLVLGSTDLALAQRDDQVAAELLRRGVALAEAGHHERAIEWFQRARALVPNDRIDVNLADSLTHVGRWAEAERILARLREDPAVHPLIADLARERLQTLRARTGTVEVRVFPVPENALLVIDERPHGVARAAMELRVGPGHHRVALVTYEGEVLARAAVEVEVPERHVVELSPVAAPAARHVLGPSVDVRADVERARGASQVDAWLWVGVGVGLAAAAAVAIALGVVLSQPIPAEGTLPTIRLPGEAM